MLQDYFVFHLNKAHYELIEEGEKYYGEASGLKEVWATERRWKSAGKIY